MVKNIRNEPWLAVYQDYVKKHDIKNKNNKKWAYRLIRKQYRLDNSSKYDKWFYKATKWFVATAFIGQFDDEFASKMEPLTGISKKHSQDWNSFWSSIDHVVFVYGGIITATNSSSYSDFVSNLGTASLFITAPMAAYNFAWNIYRVANRDDKARGARGYVGLISNGLIHLKDSSSDIIDFSKAAINSNYPGTLLEFNLENLPYFDSNNNLIDDKKQTDNTNVHTHNRLEKIINTK